MKSIAAAEMSQPESTPTQGRVVDGSLRLLFRSAAGAPWLVRLLKPLIVWLTYWCSPAVRRGTAANLQRIQGPQVTPRQCAIFARRAIGRFCDFVLAVGSSAAASPQELRRRIESTEGETAYFGRRKRGDGAVIVTAHMGSFEIGLAALAEAEPNIHVVFKRDAFDGFESSRRALREKLGIHESPIDDGWSTWMSLRDALRANQVVVLQGDRAMPGQKYESVPVFGGHLRLPVGPFKLALASGSPVIPIFTVMTSAGRCRIFIEPAIEVSGDDLFAALASFAQTLGRFISKYPDQWLVLHPAFEEDQKPVDQRAEAIA